MLYHIKSRPDRYLKFLARALMLRATAAIRPSLNSESLSELPRIAGTALVMGSAPNPTMPAGADSSWFRITINASQFALRKLGLPDPNLTIFQSRIRREDEGRQAYWDVLAGRGTDHLIFSVKRKNDGTISDFLRGKDYHPRKITYMRRLQKNVLAREVSGRLLISPHIGDRSISNGMFAVLLALRLGADRVVVAGFSMQDGWSHSNVILQKRDHQEMDSWACRRLMEKRFPVFTSEPGFARATGLPLWGDPSSAIGGLVNPYAVAGREKSRS